MTKVFETPLYPYSRSPDQDAAEAVRHPVVVVGAGPVGLAVAIDLAGQGVPVIVLDDNDRVSFGSRAICFSKRTLEILDRLGCGDALVDKGVQWNLGRVYFDERQVFEFNLLPENGHKRPAFINLQQYYLEQHLIERVRALQANGTPIELRGKNRATTVAETGKGVRLTVETPDGPYVLFADWLVACDGAGSPTRKQLGLDFVGRVFEDNFLIADIVMEDSPSFPVERRFWFDPPFNRGQSALLHKQPDNVWRVDLQLGWDIDKQEEAKPEKVIPRLKAFLGEEARFELDWVSIYTFQCRRMEKFRHGHVVFAGDSAHQVSPFGARGANSGIQDADNLAWKLKLVIQGRAPEHLLDSYNEERVQAADENILHSSRSTDFITPKSEMSRLFRDAVLDLSEHYPATRPMVNSGRLSLPTIYDGSPLNGPDCTALPERTRPGAAAADAPVEGSWLLDRLGGRFQLLTIDAQAPERLELDGIVVERIALSVRGETSGPLRERWLGRADSVVALLRPDQHVAARWESYDEKAVRAALGRAIGREARGT
ncbi:FAD-dependent oxidoreductase [Rhizobium sp. ARZ01]|uniref:FAD-dependent oxidoreductase n=1 Tax=Rhizobium sp. ARZ01 TaxID=2769313 RepID=UPI00177E0D15|nr:FAD-dependent oxidoreductase [Rhizobium sp. ARZ01]MBD9375142.1 FAD-dependent oxidoreductase [Rhizobium sp. ARZ01]